MKFTVQIDVQMCCSGYQCGCMGMPVEPPVCSDECYDKYMEERKRFKKGPVVLKRHKRHK